jgi:type III secretion protein R
VNPDDMFSKPIGLVVALALVSLLPVVFMSVTSFVKIATVLQIARSAIGAQNIPSSTVVMGLAAVLTMLSMAPVGRQIADRTAPLLVGKHDTAHLVAEGIAAVREPLRQFMRANARPTEVARFLTIAKGQSGSQAVAEDDLVVLVPAFVITELSEAFAIGVLIFLPFLMVDLVVANVLLALGMMQMSPTQVSLPLKLLLFVAVDGWGLLSQALVAGYR